MRGLNLIALFNKKGDRVLMCTRRKDPYKGLINFPGGKIELGEDGLTAAYRELEEETAVTFEDVNLIHLMTFTYPLDNCYTATKTTCSGRARTTTFSICPNTPAKAISGI